MTGVSCSFTYLAAIAKALEGRNVIEVEASKIEKCNECTAEIRRR